MDKDIKVCIIIYINFIGGYKMETAEIRNTLNEMKETISSFRRSL
jgi:ATP-dependent protease ClpP protease subunit